MMNVYTELRAGLNASESDWNGFPMLTFRFEDRDAILVLPENATGQWLMKTEYFWAFQDTELALVKEGYALAYIANDNRWGTDEDCHRRARFADMLSEKVGLRKRSVLVGMSCGGLIAVNFASRYPEYVSFLYLDAPVMNLLSCPMGFGCGISLDNGGGWEELKAAYGFTLTDLINYRRHPMDRLDVLTDNRLPCALVWGDSDEVVPFTENGIHVLRHYEAAGLPIFKHEKAGCGHHPHGMADPAPLVKYIMENEL